MNEDGATSGIYNICGWVEIFLAYHGVGDGIMGLAGGKGGEWDYDV